MQNQRVSGQNSAVSVMPTSFKWHVKAVEVKSYLILFVTFNDGTQGEVTISLQWLTGVFSALKEPEIFNSVFVKHGAITWPNGLDPDPKNIYDAIYSSGHYVIQ